MCVFILRVLCVCPSLCVPVCVCLLASRSVCVCVCVCVWLAGQGMSRIPHEVGLTEHSPSPGPVEAGWGDYHNHTKVTPPPPFSPAPGDFWGGVYRATGPDSVNHTEATLQYQELMLEEHTTETCLRGLGLPGVRREVAKHRQKQTSAAERTERARSLVVIPWGRTDAKMTAMESTY